MSAPRFNILTQKELTIDLSRPAMEYIIYALSMCPVPTIEYSMECELDNFTNTLLNLLERSETRAGGELPLIREDNSSFPETAPGILEPGNFDLVGE